MEWDFLLVDDGSTDETWSVIRSSSSGALLSTGSVRPALAGGIQRSPDRPETGHDRKLQRDVAREPAELADLAHQVHEPPTRAELSAPVLGE